MNIQYRLIKRLMKENKNYSINSQIKNIIDKYVSVNSYIDYDSIIKELLEIMTPKEKS